MNDRILKWFAYTVLTMMAFTMLLVFYWLLYPYKPIEFSDVRTMKKSYRPGEVFSLSISHCKHMPLPAAMVRQFIDGIVYTLKDDTHGANNPVGCATRIATDIEVPATLQPGEYLYRQSMTYKVNPLREITVVFETNKFKVTESTASSTLRLQGY